MNQLIDWLIQYGLSEKEAKIYVATLSLWSAPAGTIARHSWVTRVTTYTILSELQKKWIVHKIKRKGLYYFSVIEPAGLLHALQTKLEWLQELLPTFAMLTQAIGNKPQIQYLEGKDWLKQMFTDFMTLDTSQPMKAILGNTKFHNDQLLRASQEYRKYMAKEKFLFKRILTHHDVDVTKTLHEDNLYHRETRLIQDFPINIQADISIYAPHSCAIIFFDDHKYAHIILIKSPKVFELFDGLFEYIRDREGPLTQT